MLIEFVCRQKAQPQQTLTFEETLQSVRDIVRINHFQAFWKEDVEGEPMFMDVFVGRSLLHRTLAEETKTTIPDLQFYEEDQRLHGAYQKLQTMTMIQDNTLIFNLHSDLVTDRSYIRLIESFGFNDLYQIWVLIPHKPEKNQFSSGLGFSEKSGRPPHSVTCDYGNGEKKTFYAHTFNPQRGDRLALYSYGQWAMVSLSKPGNPELFFNQSGYLQLNF